ncbi:MAG: hypothetical protein J5747_03735, partial [Spirochaetaceae bacterium]|nr:hypothetical protein [Spirochaetaceae bacterium]
MYFKRILLQNGKTWGILAFLAGYIIEGHEKTNGIMRCESHKNASQSGIQSDIRTSIMPHISTAETTVILTNQQHPLSSMRCAEKRFFVK